jgi:hypothetical protein
MPRPILNLGAAVNDKTGTKIRAGGAMINTALAALYFAVFGGDNEAVPLIRTLESFGAVAIANRSSGTLIDNLAAITAAFVWSNDVGGIVIAGHGIYGINGTAILTPYVQMFGAGERNSTFRQMSVATSSGGTYADVFATPTAAQGGSFATGLFDIGIDGGWRDHKGFEGQVGATAWEFDPALATQCGVRYDCPSNGPSHSSLRSDDGSNDSHHRLERVLIKHVFGFGTIQTGRGEIQTRSVKFVYCAGNGILADCPDNLFSDCIITLTGDSGFKITSGNQGLSNIKSWFCGMRKTVEPVGACFEILGAGVSNVIMSSCRTQDSFGPGLVFEGDGHMIQIQIDNASGGRVKSGGNGWTSANGGPSGTGGQVRSLPQTNIRVNNAKNCKVSATITHDSTVDPAFPNLVDFRNSGADLVDIDLRVATANIVRSVSAAAGLATQKRWNRVLDGMFLRYGKVTAANLADALHSINKVGGPSTAELDTGFATRADAGNWSVFSIGSTVTPV